MIQVPFFHTQKRSRPAEGAGYIRTPIPALRSVLLRTEVRKHENAPARSNRYREDAALEATMPGLVYGYTLIELVVSVGIFSMVMLVATGAYVSLIGLDRQSRSTNDLTTNLSFSIESISRSLRTGTSFACTDSTANKDAYGNSTDGSCHQITFNDSNLGAPNPPTTSVTFRRNSDGTIGKCVAIAGSSCSDSTATTLTDSRISIPAGGLVFYVRGIGTGDSIQPQAIFTLQGSMSSGNAGQTQNFSIQSTATQRLNETEYSQSTYAPYSQSGYYGEGWYYGEGGYGYGEGGYGYGEGGYGYGEGGYGYGEGGYGYGEGGYGYGEGGYGYDEGGYGYGEGGYGYDEGGYGYGEGGYGYDEGGYWDGWY